MKTSEELVTLREILKDELGPVTKDIKTMQSDIADVKGALVPIKNDVKTIKSDIAETRNDVKVLIAYFDREYVNLRKRIDKIEEHLGLLTS